MTKWEGIVRQIVLDTETTGLSTAEGHRIIEIGCVELINRRYTGNNLHCYFNPGRDIELGALDVHGITQEFLADKPVFHDMAERLMEYLQNAELIIHNAPFDVGFLDYELQLTGKTFKPILEYCGVVDTLVIARQKHPGQQNNLDALCKRYNVDNSQREFHGALLDAKLLAEVYLAMTGGQTSLFAESHVVQTATYQSQASDIAQRQFSLPVIRVNTEEQQAHLQRLEAMKNISGKCVWDVETTI